MAFTFFFRDTEALELLVEHALPAVRGQSRIRVWDAGCAHGPEAYTLAILLRERMSSFLFRNVTIHASDVDASFAARVGEGIYPEGELGRIPAELFTRYFSAAERPGCFQIAEEIRRRVEFHRHDLLSLQPLREGLSLIVCKNVLLHFEERQRCDVLRMFHAAMRTDGLLVMEQTQKMPEELRPLFQQVAPHAQVYRKVEIPAGLAPRRGFGALRRVDVPVDHFVPSCSYKFPVSSGG